ncbi:sigma-70 family RNA polymerase sigma factor [Cupriavidus basilensis]|uniref:Sigma-70 family RNA polymerase sigma factor n=1 Tax=Cupriavidus basilensis TaxID=68895 RepID=A0ABT6AX51_9BURK|nr:sigma-70 family RNA polymerase sigma factor [Cupriavidus basilensis]MDF3836817.1 sigma-70 family RNA polymerase sigma factor [Cupriavidus basilensis]
MTIIPGLVLSAAERQDSDDAKAEAVLWQQPPAARDAGWREQVVLRYLPYTRSIAARLFAGRLLDDLDFADLYQLACIGLLECIDRFDPARGVSFVTYCTPRIEGNVLSGLQRLSDGQEQISLRRRMRRDRLASLRQQDGERAIGLERLAEVSVGLAIGFMLDGTSMYGDADQTGQDTGYDSLLWKQTRNRLLGCVKLLPAREQKVLMFHYFHHLQFDQIALIMMLTKGRISQLHRGGLDKLRGMVGPDDRRSSSI